MKPMILFAAIVLATATPLLAADKSYDLKGFSKVVVRGGVDVKVHSGEDFRVHVDVSRRSLLRRLNVQKSGDTLIIERKGSGGFFLFGMADSYEVTVELPELSSVKAVAGADVHVDGTLAQDVTASASSGADLDLDGIVANRLSLKSSSGADLEASGTCSDLSARVSSGADLSASDLVCSRLALRASSGGDLEAHGTEAASATASSGGDIVMYGEAVVQQFRESSGGNIRTAL